MFTRIHHKNYSIVYFNYNKLTIEFWNAILIKVVIFWLNKFEFHKEPYALTFKDPRWLGYQRLENNFAGTLRIQWNEKRKFLWMDALEMKLAGWWCLMKSKLFSRHTIIIWWIYFDELINFDVLLVPTMIIFHDLNVWTLNILILNKIQNQHALFYI